MIELYIGIGLKKEALVSHNLQGLGLGPQRGGAATEPSIVSTFARAKPEMCSPDTNFYTAETWTGPMNVQLFINYLRMTSLRTFFYTFYPEFSIIWPFLICLQKRQLTAEATT